jgi:NAD(P) transhydrogenase subunit alpha
MNTVQIMMVLYVFVLAIFVGFELISKVPPTLHTPLMSGSNAISGITILGATIVAGKYGDWSHWTGILGFFAVLFGALNVYGGYIVTDRMLQMFKTKKDKK